MSFERQEQRGMSLDEFTDMSIKTLQQQFSVDHGTPIRAELTTVDVEPRTIGGREFRMARYSVDLGVRLTHRCCLTCSLQGRRQIFQYLTMRAGDVYILTFSCDPSDLDDAMRAVYQRVLQSLHIGASRQAHMVLVPRTVALTYAAGHGAAPAPHHWLLAFPASWAVSLAGAEGVREGARLSSEHGHVVHASYSDQFSRYSLTMAHDSTVGDLSLEECEALLLAQLEKGMLLGDDTPEVRPLQAGVLGRVVDVATSGSELARHLAAVLPLPGGGVVFVHCDYQTLPDSLRARDIVESIVRATTPPGCPLPPPPPAGEWRLYLNLTCNFTFEFDYATYRPRPAGSTVLLVPASLTPSPGMVLETAAGRTVTVGWMLLPPHERHLTTEQYINKMREAVEQGGAARLTDTESLTLHGLPAVRSLVVHNEERIASLVVRTQDSMYLVSWRTTRADYNANLSKFARLIHTFRVVVHPLVLLSAVDHYTRAAASTSRRVVGILLGSVSRGVVDVTNSYAVPFDEDPSNPAIWFLDHNYHENMWAMFRKVNAAEKVIGWYSTGPQLRPNDIDIHSLVRKFATNPVFVIIDVRPSVAEVPTKAYVAVDEVNEEQQTVTRFQHVPCAIGALEAEEVGVEHLLRDVKDSNVSTLSTRIRDKLSSLKSLGARLAEMEAYLRHVLAQRLPVNQAILRQIQEIFNLLPNVSRPELVEALAAETNDSLLAIYVANLVRSITALHDLIDNKAALAAYEEGAKADKKEEKKDEKKEDTKSHH